MLQTRWITGRHDYNRMKLNLSHFFLANWEVQTTNKTVQCIVIAFGEL